MGGAEAGVKGPGPSKALVLPPQITLGMSFHFQLYPLNAAAGSLDIILRTDKRLSDGHRKADQLRRLFPMWSPCLALYLLCVEQVTCNSAPPRTPQALALRSCSQSKSQK